MSRRPPLGLEAVAISTLRHFYIGESLLIRQVTLLFPLQLLLQHGCLQRSMALYSFLSLTASLVAPCPSEELRLLLNSQDPRAYKGLLRVDPPPCLPDLWQGKVRGGGVRSSWAVHQKHINIMSLSHCFRGKISVAKQK